VAMRRFDEALAIFQDGLKLDPLSPPLNAYLGMAYQCAGDYDLSIKQCLLALEIEPDYLPAYAALGVAHLMKGEFAAAIGVFQQQLHAARAPLVLTNLAHAYAVAGQHDDARRALDELTEQAARQPIPALYFGLIHLGLKESERVWDYLEKAFTERDALLPAYLNSDPRFQSMRGAERAQDLLRRMNLL